VGDRYDRVGKGLRGLAMVIVGTAITGPCASRASMRASPMRRVAAVRLQARECAAKPVNISAMQPSEHTHKHTHADGTQHAHPHGHPDPEHDHDHEAHEHEHIHADGTKHSHPHAHPGSEDAHDHAH
jgi:hypothetical protein